MTTTALDTHHSTPDMGSQVASHNKRFYKIDFKNNIINDEYSRASQEHKMSKSQNKSKSVGVKQRVGKFFTGAGRESVVGQAMRHIYQAAELQEKMRKDDPKAIFSYYDRNRAIHTAIKCSKGQQLGTCGKDSKDRFEDVAGTRRQFRVQLSLATGGLGIAPVYLKKKVINHYANIYIDEENKNAGFHKWRYETYSNGKHMDILLWDKLRNQKFVKYNFTHAYEELYTDEDELVELFELMELLSCGVKFHKNINDDDYYTSSCGFQNRLRSEIVKPGLVECIDFGMKCQNYYDNNRPEWLKYDKNNQEPE